MVVDVRNAYEIRIGKFKGAVDPQTDSFRDFPAWANQHLSSGSQELCKGDHGEPKAESQALLNEEANINVMNQSSNPQRIAMYCTGGIRCEKATSFLINQGFQEVGYSIHTHELATFFHKDSVKKDLQIMSCHLTWLFAILWYYQKLF